LAATGRTCPQTGWWEPSEPDGRSGGQRQHIKAGDRMPHVVATGQPSLWQKLTREMPSYQTATVWKLVGYDIAGTPAPDSLDGNASRIAVEPGETAISSSQKKG